MTGPEHYVLAEKLLTEATRARGEAARIRRIAEAQVHATLAAAAASALSGSGLESATWRDAAGTVTAIPGEHG